MHFAKGAAAAVAGAATGANANVDTRANANANANVDTRAVCSHPAFSDKASALYGTGLDRLTKAGLNKIPAWLRPYGALSNGERSRVDL